MVLVSNNTVSGKMYLDLVEEHCCVFGELSMVLKCYYNLKTLKMSLLNSKGIVHIFTNLFSVVVKLLFENSSEA